MLILKVESCWGSGSGTHRLRLKRSGFRIRLEGACRHTADDTNP